MSMNVKVNVDSDTEMIILKVTIHSCMVLHLRDYGSWAAKVGNHKNITSSIFLWLGKIGPRD